MTPGLLAATGCAYTFRGNLPDHLTKVRVSVFRNETDLVDLEAELTRRIIAEFSGDGRLRVVRRGENCRLHGRIVRYARRPLREDSTDDVVEAQIHLVAEITFTDLKNGREHRRRISNAETDALSGRYNLRRGEFEALGRRRAVEDLARNVVRAVTEIWDE